MDPILFGGDVRLLRHRRSWTQAQLAGVAKVSRFAISEIECGRASSLPLQVLISVAGALGARLSVRLLWQGEGLDRLRDRRHAALVERMVRRLESDGWSVVTEASFSIFGERGSIDILAFHPASGAVLVVEVKSTVPDLQGMLVALDRKTRLAAQVPAAGPWEIRSVSRLLVLPEDRTSRRRVSLHEATFRTAFPTRNVEVGRWLRAPAEPLSGLLFLPSDGEGSIRRRIQARPGPAGPEEGPIGAVSPSIADM